MKGRMSQCSSNEECFHNKKDICETCDGTSEVRVSGYVYAGEPHVADVDTAPCPDCSKVDEDDYQEEE